MKQKEFNSDRSKEPFHALTAYLSRLTPLDVAGHLLHSIHEEGPSTDQTYQKTVLSIHEANIKAGWLVPMPCKAVSAYH